MAQYDIYGIGAALVDTEIEVHDNELTQFAIAKGVMTLVDEPRQHELMAHLAGHLVAAKRASGGSAANSIIAAAYLGSRTFFSCKVANDDNGHFYLGDLTQAGVRHPTQSLAPEGITGKCLVLITPDAERTMNTFLGISETLSPLQIDEAALSASRCVYIEGYLVTSPTGRQAAIRLRQLAKAQGVTTALSLSDPAMVNYFKEGLLDILGDGVDILFCNQHEALAFTGADTLDDARQQLLAYCSHYAITCGSEGAWVFDGETSHFVPAQAVQAVDTNGAGDMFAGAFLHAVLQGYAYPTAAQFANCAAAQVVSQFGPRLAPSQYPALRQQLAQR